LFAFPELRIILQTAKRYPRGNFTLYRSNNGFTGVYALKIPLRVISSTGVYDYF
jgi:hypothetical protein